MAHTSPQNAERFSDLTPQQKKSGLAAWLGWMFDGLDMHLYTLVAAPFVMQLLGAVSTADPLVKEKSSWIQAAFLVGWALGGGFFGRLGDKLGRSLGFPTANIALAANPPLSGIFAVRIHGLDGPAGPEGKARTGVASLGVRPTVKQNAKPLLEVFVFDFDKTIYGRRVSVEFLRKLRDEEKYEDLTALTAQIRVDVAQARDYFAATR